MTRARLFIMPHLGLGDAILLNGLVRVLAPAHQTIAFPAKRHNVPSVKWMFSDLPGVVVVPVEDDGDGLAKALAAKSLGWDTLMLGLYGPNFLCDEHHFDECFYLQAGVNPDMRSGRFHVPDRGVKFKVDKAGRHLSFVVEDTSRGFLMDGARLTGEAFFPCKMPTIFDWLEMIKLADDIHCIDSAFMCWIDCMKEDGKGLFWHQYARKNEDPRVHPKWHRNWQVLT